MDYVGRGTTPYNRFTIGKDLRNAEVIWLTYKQGSRIVIDKTKDDLEIEENLITVHLTQKETLALKDTIPVRIQLRARFPDGEAVKTNIIDTEASEILKEGVI